MEDVVIIGGGPAGLSAGIYLARAGLKPYIFAGSPPGGQLTLTSEVENYPGYESILGSELIDKMRHQAERFGAVIVNENVLTLDFAQKVKQINSIKAQAVLIATGAKALWLNIPSEQRLRGKGVSACATCDGFFFKNKTVAVVGGGDTALEEALTLARFAIKVYIIHRRDSFRASKIMQQKAMENNKIEIIWNAGVEEVLGEKKVEGIRIVSIDSVSRAFPVSARLAANSPDLRAVGTPCTSATYRKIALDGLFIAIGHKPDTDLFKGKIELDAKGYIMTTARTGWELMKGQEVKKELFKSPYQTATSMDGVFAAGDCVDIEYRQVATAAGMGVGGALDVERWLEEQPEA